MEIEIVTLVVKGSAKLTVPTYWKIEKKLSKKKIINKFRDKFYISEKCKSEPAYFTFVNICRREKKRSDSVLWQMSLHPQKKSKKQSDKTKSHKNFDYADRS